MAAIVLDDEQPHDKAGGGQRQREGNPGRRMLRQAWSMNAMEAAYGAAVVINCMTLRGSDGDWNAAKPASIVRRSG